ncbi:MAG TPA: hypothetical protein VFV78_04420 [Vicinamibacterales bacterium]|nr:hypothetical protein [Vicinamibacterales bacterium]
MRARTPVFGAFLEGWRRVLKAPVLAVSMLAATFLLALPLGLVMERSIDAHLGRSLEADAAARGWNAGWAAEFGSQARGFERTFTYDILGFGGTLAIVSDLIDNIALDPALSIAAAASIALWVALSGGLLDRFARGRPVRTAQFFSACGVYAVRFARLALVVGAAYYALFRWLHPFLFERVYRHVIRDMTSEREAAMLRIGLYIVFLLALALVGVLADVARVRAVVEDRRSMLGALGASWRFIRRRPFRIAGLLLLNGLAWLVILRLWLAVAPGATASAGWAFAITELYLFVRVCAKLAFMASEVVFFQGDLAHAQYTAAPEIIWPDAPAAEAIRNLSRRARRES